MLRLSVGQYSSAGVKAENQDCLGAKIPKGAEMQLKGGAVAIADGISSSTVSAEASQTAVTSFLADYYCTSDAWSVAHAGEKVLAAINNWLFAQTRNSPFASDPDKGYVCTFSAIVLRQQQGHLFHSGDSRIYRYRDGAVEQLTRDHRVWGAARQSYLSHALGAKPALELDMHQVSLNCGDVFFLCTDGVYEHIDEADISDILSLQQDNLDEAAKTLVEKAFAQGSDDNLSVQLVKVDELGEATGKILRDHEHLPIPPVFKLQEQVDGFVINRHLHASARSHIYLATEIHSGKQVVLKAPSIEMGDNEAHLEKLLLEEWVAKRVSSAHVVSVPQVNQARSYLYVVNRFVAGQTLSQWLLDNPHPDLETVRDIVEQIAKGLMALHRAGILHQDIRPENILIDVGHSVTIIDLGSAHIAGINVNRDYEMEAIPGTALYTAPEFFIGDLGTERSDLFSLAVLTYHMLSNRFPYGTDVAKTASVAGQNKLQYRSVLDPTRALPIWLDATLEKALQVNPMKRYQTMSEFIYDLRNPNPRFVNRQRPPLLERNPVLVWQGVSLLLAVALALSLLN